MEKAKLCAVYGLCEKDNSSFEFHLVLFRDRSNEKRRRMKGKNLKKMEKYPVFCSDSYTMLKKWIYSKALFKPIQK